MVRYKILRGLGKLATDHQLRVDRGAMETAAQQNLIEHLRLLSQWVPLSEGQKKRADGGMDSGAIVLSLLEDKLRQSLERAFRLLQLAHRSEDLRNVYKALRSTDKRLRANASEFLDALTVNSPETRTLFRLVTDDLTPRERLDRATEHLEVPPTDYEGTVARLLADPDESVAAIASYHALDLGVIDLRDKVTDAFQNRPSLRAVAAPSILPPSLRSTHPSMIPV